MSTFRFEGNLKLGGLPRKSNLRIEALPKKHLVFEGQVSEALHIELDPGKYAYSVVRKSSPPRIDDAIYQGEFYHEITPEAFKALQMYEPRLFKIIHTSDGVRWRCEHPLCDFEASASTAALIHEMEHFGISKSEFVADPTGGAAKAAGVRATEFSEQIKAALRKAGKGQTTGVPA